MMHLVIRGRVQGVGFRWFVREEAQGLGLAGWVRNRPDGAVEVLAEGKAEALEAFREQLRKGPPGADVRSLEAVSGALDVPPANPFTIVR